MNLYTDMTRHLYLILGFVVIIPFSAFVIEIAKLCCAQAIGYKSEYSYTIGRLFEALFTLRESYWHANLARQMLFEGGEFGLIWVFVYRFITR